jgi:uncharacterized protein (DUF1499 family)
MVLVSLLPHWLLVLSLGLFQLVGPVPPELGVHGGSLAPCPSPAHCARADWPSTDPEAALARLLPVIEALPRTQVLERSGDYLHATCSSALFGFVDDLELHVDAAAGVLQARSVSRLGDSDLGVNGRRLAALEGALTATAAATASASATAAATAAVDAGPA